MEDQSFVHIPVMVDEVIRFLAIKSEAIYVDTTIGEGGHAEAILKVGGKVIGIDQDESALQRAAKRLAPFGKQVKLIHSNFRNLSQVLPEAGVSKIEGILYDLGMSSYQIASPGRGFSFKYDAPLDMRMDPSNSIRAIDLINSLPLNKLIWIISQYGQEHRAKQIAREIIKRRPIYSTFELIEAVITGLPPSSWRAKIHPATRTFQALRIAVNDELNALNDSLNQAIELLDRGGRIVALSYHSLEDRIVKLKFRQLAAQESPLLNIITKKPLLPVREEIQANPRARSAKLRAAEKI